MLDSTRGTLVPPWYRAASPDAQEMRLVNITLGVTLGIWLWGADKAFTQTRASWKKHRRVNAYMALIWSELAACLVFSLIAWCFLNAYYGPRFVSLSSISPYDTNTKLRLSFELFFAIGKSTSIPETQLEI